MAEGDRILEIGDKVRVTTKGGELYSFKVTTLSPDLIGGDEIQVSVDDIALIEVKELNAARTAGLGAGTIVAGAAVFMVALSALVVVGF